VPPEHELRLLRYLPQAARAVSPRRQHALRPQTVHRHHLALVPKPAPEHQGPSTQIRKQKRRTNLAGTGCCRRGAGAGMCKLARGRMGARLHSGAPESGVIGGGQGRGLTGCPCRPCRPGSTA
jgi:hypothetical protein